VKFLIDAQLPRRLARRLGTVGHDAVHTLDLPAGNRTTDAEICRLANLDDRVVVTKDADFVNSYLLSRRASRCGRLRRPCRTLRAPRLVRWDWYGIVGTGNSPGNVAPI